MTEPNTIGAALAGAIALLRGETSSPQLDAELLLAHVLKQPRTSLLTHRADPLPASAARAFTSLMRRRAEGIPIPYLTGRTEFYGRPFVVTPAVMVPRPASEAIVGEALRLLGTAYHERHPERSEGASQNDSKSPIVADIGTGSGVLAVSIAAEAPRVRVVTTDNSAAALLVARRNARKHRVARPTSPRLGGTGRMTFIESDLLTEIPPDLAPTMIVANLPYVPSDELKRAGGSLETRGLAFEPPRALDGGPDGLFVIRRFFAQLKRWQLRGALRHLILEHSPGQRRRILELAHATLPTFTPRAVSLFVTSWTRNEASR